MRLQPQVTGIYGDEVTPVPIPNTEVKLISVENTWLATAWEDRAMPVQMENSLSGLQMGSFLLCKKRICEEKMELRRYRASDCDKMAELFYQTVHCVNARDYTKE